MNNYCKNFCPFPCFAQAFQSLKKLLQFPLASCFSYTAYKAQGKTLEEGAIVDLKKPPTGKLESSYAMLLCQE